MTRGVMKRFLYVLHQGVCKNAEPQGPFPGTLSLGISKPPGYVQGQCQEKAKAEGWRELKAPWLQALLLWLCDLRQVTSCHVQYLPVA